MSVRIIRGATVTSPKGFIANGLYAGIKRAVRPDLALLVSERPAVSAACFTTNRVKAWPVLHDMAVIRRRTHRAIIANSGNANCANGEQGRRAMLAVIEASARQLKIARRDILVASTGVIGKLMPVARILRHLPLLVSGLTREGGHLAAWSILTTDRVAKEAGFTWKSQGQAVRLAGMAKGAGMVHPNMATTLTFITTDAAVSKGLAQRALREAVDRTLNRFSIDNDQSTNDTIFLLANGASGAPPVRAGSPDETRFREALERTCASLVEQMAYDGEGVTKICRIRVTGAAGERDADRVARQIANSMLFKTMLAGSNANWGRVAAACGASGVAFDPRRLRISFGGSVVFRNGRPALANLPAVRKYIRRQAIEVGVDLGRGRAAASFLSTDLTRAYVRINEAVS